MLHSAYVVKIHTDRRERMSAVFARGGFDPVDLFYLFSTACSVLLVNTITVSKVMLTTLMLQISLPLWGQEIAKTSRFVFRRFLVPFRAFGCFWHRTVFYYGVWSNAVC